jgi:hypothetical protein
MVASNEVYVDEMRKLVQRRLTLADQETAVRETIMRNKEERLRNKKQLNVVDEMMLGLLCLEKSYGKMKALVSDILEQCITEERVGGGY